jgi:hypothetical protein
MMTLQLACSAYRKRPRMAIWLRNLRGQGGVMRRDTFLAIGVLILILGALAAKSLLLSVPPVRTAPGEFNADRAKARLAYILGDERPHPADSEADDMVRARLVTVLQQMGLKPIVRAQFACNDFQKARLVACARVRNVIAIIGPPTGKALLLSAHYDSVPVGPGASDDGIGVATLLEVGSILKDRPLKRPIILLFNEGEELGLIGARAFLADPLSRNVDSLLNFEARGVNGPVTMFETSQPNGVAVAAYAASVRRPYASSLSTDVARLIPNDTDVTTYKERGWLTLNSATRPAITAPATVSRASTHAACRIWATKPWRLRRRCRPACRGRQETGSSSISRSGYLSRCRFGLASSVCSSFWRASLSSLGGAARPSVDQPSCSARLSPPAFSRGWS